MIWANAARCPISAQCGIPGVPRSTYYRMIEHPETERADPIAGDVRAAWRDGRERYGARKIKAAPERRGVTASSRRIGNICANTNRPPKKELAYRDHCTTIEQLRRDLNDYVWRSDNQRLHSPPPHKHPKSHFSAFPCPMQSTTPWLYPHQ